MFTEAQTESLKEGILLGNYPTSESSALPVLFSYQYFENTSRLILKNIIQLLAADRRSILSII
jgi:hypothetical protein